MSTQGLFNTDQYDSDPDGTDINDDAQINEPAGSCENCGVNIYEENADSGLCDQCEWATHYRKPSQ